MATFWDPAARESFCQRIACLTPETKPRWGRFTAAQMVAHVNDALRMAMGELPVKRKAGPLRYWPLKPLILYVLPIPKGAPTAPELLARCGDADLASEQAEFRTLAARAAARSAADRWPEHPAFGALSYAEWGALAHKHTEHHLRQFGV
jgi:hypothetical protein